MRAFGLPVEVPLAFVGDEKCANRAVLIVRPEVAVAFVEARDYAVRLLLLQDGTADPRVAQFLSQPQIFGLGDLPEFRSVFLVVLVEQVLRTEPWARRQQHRQQTKEK